jgi:hypothetical protein
LQVIVLVFLLGYVILQLIVVEPAPMLVTTPLLDTFATLFLEVNINILLPSFKRLYKEKQ